MTDTSFKVCNPMPLNTDNDTNVLSKLPMISNCKAYTECSLNEPN